MMEQGYDSSITRRKSKSFAIRVIHFVRFLQSQKHEQIISLQLYRSGTSILERVITLKVRPILLTN